MKWQLGRRSTNVEDRRGGGGRLPIGGFKLGGCGLFLIIAIALLTGQNPLQFLGAILSQQQESAPPQQAPSTPQDPQGPVYDEEKDFVERVLGDMEDTWAQIFSRMGRTFEPPRLVLFEQAIQSGCGFGSAAVGPFYCPLDQKVYIDLVFFRQLHQQFGAPGDFARAYVIAHEVGHHVQNLLGISDQVRQMQQRGSEEQANALSVRLELQADCFAGVWAHNADQSRQLLEAGDFEEGLGAAAAVGDDRIQREAGRAVSPESWTHGSSEMRKRWFTRGFETGDVNTCDTFKDNRL
jgi:predicted metalloprotease